VIGCKDGGSCSHKCPGVFNITRIEFDFYKRFNIPVPDFCPNCRFYMRMEKLNPIETRDGECMCENKSHLHKGKCPATFKTNYSSKNQQILYCEECYKQEMY
jgi:hypothetical protein